MCTATLFYNNNNQPYLVRVTLNSKADKPVALISGSNWNLKCWFLWREENQGNLQQGENQKTNSTNIQLCTRIEFKPHWREEHFHDCSIHASQINQSIHPSSWSFVHPSDSQSINQLIIHLTTYSYSISELLMADEGPL